MAEREPRAGKRKFYCESRRNFSKKEKINRRK